MRRFVATVSGVGDAGASLSWWRRLRAAHVRFNHGFYGDRLVVVDGQLAMRRRGPWFRPRLVFSSDGLLVPVRPWSTSGSRVELRRWDAEWALAVKPRWTGRARLVLDADDDGYRGPLAGEWVLGYADAVVELVEQLRADSSAQAGLAEPDRVRRLVTLLDGRAWNWPVTESTRRRALIDALAVVRGDQV